MSLRTKLIIPVCLLAGSLTDLAGQTPDQISQRDRVLMATKIYHQISTFFPDLSQSQFDRDYGDYLAEVLSGSDDRRAFDLASMALVATLHDGHSFFYDTWIAQHHGQPVGFTAYPLDSQWVVVRSGLPAIRVGDVIQTIDGISTQQFFERNRKFISASSDRDAATSLFDTPVLFPERFTVALEGGRQVVIDRAHDSKQESPATAEGRWLVPGSVGYIKVPTFHGITTQATAIDYLRQFKDAKAVILDVRGNAGGDDPGPLQQALMVNPYPMWTESTVMKGGFLLRNYDVAYPELARLTTGEATVRRLQTVFTGQLFLLIDRRCSCSCENFVMPFKMTKRARLLGETTAGTFSFTNFTQFENGMITNIASVRHTFPDGSRFEGVGIVPDIEIHPTAQDLRAGQDVVLEQARRLAGQA